MNIKSLDIDNLKEIHTETKEQFYLRMIAQDPNNSVWKQLLENYYCDEIYKKLLIVFKGE